MWDHTVVGWLHANALDLLEHELLAEYLEILRHLRHLVGVRVFVFPCP